MYECPRRFSVGWSLTSVPGRNLRHASTLATASTPNTTKSICQLSPGASSASKPPVPAEMPTHRTIAPGILEDRQTVVEGKGRTSGVDAGGARIQKKKRQRKKI